MKNYLLIALLSVTMLIGCKSAEFTMMSTKQVDMTQQYTLKKAGAIGKSADFQTAVEKCIESAGGTYITNVRIYQGLFQWKVVGDVYGTK